MELGPTLALLASVSFAATQVFIRRGVYSSGESVIGAAVSVFAGTVVLSLILPFTVDWGRFLSLSWQGFVMFAAAGMVNFIFARYLLFTCVRLIGGNKGSALVGSNVLFAVAFAVIFLQESVTVLLTLGIVGIMAGTALVSMRTGDEDHRLQTKGVFLGLGAALCIGVSSILVKSAIAEIGSPYAGAFISFLAASFLWAIYLLRKGQRSQFAQLPRYSLVALIVAGVLSLVAQLLRYAALSYSPVNVVQPLISTSVLFTFFLSFLINRKIDIFTWKVFTGIILVVAGIFLVFT